MKQVARFLFGTFLLGFLPSFFGVGDLEAIPAWGRKYDVSCSMCHYPAVPRLNTYGHKFRRAGYRTPEEFNKQPEFKDVGDYVSIRGRMRYKYADPEVGRETSEFQFHDATFFYSGALTPNYSAFFELEMEPEGDYTDTDANRNKPVIVANVVGLWGDPDSFWTVRAGQFHTFTRVGFGAFDRPTGISVPAIFDHDLTAGSKFKLKEDQRGIEVAYVYKDFRISGQVLNGMDPKGDGNEGSDFDTDMEKDAALAFEWILDDRASGLTVLAYRGHAEPTAGDRSFTRFAVTANKVFDNGMDVLGGLVLSNDNPVTGADIDGEAFFFALEKFFESKDQTIFGRIDLVDINTDVSDNEERRFTLGWVYSVQENLRFAVEYTNINKEVGLTGGIEETDDQLLGELMLNF